MSWFVRSHFELPISARFHLDLTKTKYNYRDKKKGVTEKKAVRRSIHSRKAALCTLVESFRAYQWVIAEMLKSAVSIKQVNSFFLFCFECHRSVEVNTFM